VVAFAVGEELVAVGELIMGEELVAVGVLIMGEEAVAVGVNVCVEVGAVVRTRPEGTVEGCNVGATN
jgi:hypothetical protein